MLALATALLFAPAGTPASYSAAATQESELVALQAGTIHLVEKGQVLTGGATILVRDGRIVSVGKDVALPANARVVDYGPDAVIIPGLVSASSTYGVDNPREAPPARTAAIEQLAVDNFDPYSRYDFDVSGGVTSAYIAPARFRLIAGQGAVVKLAGDDPDARILNASAAIHGSITATARNVPGYWKPPIPATSDVGLDVAEPQLPNSTMGAIVALRELLAIARGGDDDGSYGPETAKLLGRFIQAEKPWRVGADSAAEIRALLSLFSEQGLPLLVEGGRDAASLAAEIAAAGATVLVEVDVAPGNGDRRLGTDEDAVWPRYDTAAQLARQGVPIVIQTSASMRPRDLRFAAGVASRGGLDPEVALRAITLGPAVALGVDARVGSIAPGKDADFVVLNGAPLAWSSSVLATWIDGQTRWKAAHSGAVVIEVAELYVGDGRVLRPGQLAMLDGRILEVGERVSHPPGAQVMRGRAAMPGIVDALGHLGLSGSSKVPDIEFKMPRIVEPGDRTDRRVAKAGITTVVLAPRGPRNGGTPAMAYKPAGDDTDAMVVKDLAAVRVTWKDNNRTEAGKAVRDLLEKAVAYKQKWDEYEAALASWVPPEEAGEEPPAEEDKSDEAAEEKPEADKDQKGKKKKGEEEEEGDALTGLWEADVIVPPYLDAAHLRLRLERDGDGIVGSLRCDTVSESLVTLAGSFDEAEKKLDVRGFGTRGAVQVEGTIAKDELSGSLFLGGAEVELKAKRTERELKYARRPERRKPEAEEPKAVKGEPKSPGIDEKLEPLRQAILGHTAVVVDVDRADEILDCVKAFESAGIQPILFGADDVHKVAAELRGRVSGVLLRGQVLRTEPDQGLQSLRNRYVELNAAGIRVAFHSGAEEGAAELPLLAAYAVANGMGPGAALRALTSDAAAMMGIADRVGLLEAGLDADVLLLDGPPLEPSTSTLRTWVNGKEVP